MYCKLWFLSCSFVKIEIFECFIKWKQCWNIQKEHFGNFGLIPTFYLLNLQQSYSLLYHAEAKTLISYLKWNLDGKKKTEIVKMVNKYWHSTNTRVFTVVNTRLSQIWSPDRLDQGSTDRKVVPRGAAKFLKKRTRRDRGPMTGIFFKTRTKVDETAYFKLYL